MKKFNFIAVSIFLYLFLSTFAPLFAQIIKLQPVSKPGDEIRYLDKNLSAILGSGEISGVDYFLTKLNGSKCTNISPDHFNTISNYAVYHLLKKYPFWKPYIALENIKSEKVAEFIKNEVENFGILKKIEDLDLSKPKEKKYFELYKIVEKLVSDNLNEENEFFVANVDNGDTIEIKFLIIINKVTGRVISVSWSYTN